MRRLILLRHAKSCWTDSDLDDHDRPLSQRGRLAAPLMGAWMVEHGHVPDHVMCSSSKRTIETWERARAVTPHAPDAATDPALYHADPGTMLRLVRTAPDTAQTVLLVGHQPGIGAFVRKLADASTSAGCARAFNKFPTASCAVLDFPVERWADVDFGTGRFHSFATPRELV